MPGAHVTAIHEVEPRDGGSVVTLTLETRGPAAAIFAPLLDPFSRRNVEREAAGLKARCEAASGAS